MHQCAQHLVKHHNNCFPQQFDALIALPGVGPYTAAAIASIAFNQPVAVVDGNVKRVLSRLCGLKDLQQLNTLALQLTPQQQPGMYAQAIMDLGATICMPRNPRCDACPCMQDVMLVCTINKGAFPSKKSASHYHSKKALFLFSFTPPHTLCGCANVPREGS